MAGCGGGAACDVLVTSRDPDSEGFPGLVFLDEDGEIRGPVISDGLGIVATDPVFDADGERIAFVRAFGDYESAGPSSAAIWMVDADGTGLQRLTGSDEAEAGSAPVIAGIPTYVGPTDVEPDWSPVDDVIAFSRGVSEVDRTTGDRTYSNGIYSVRPGEPERPLVDHPAEMRDFAPAWSQDGKRLAFLRSPLEGRSDVELWTVDAAGGDAKRIASVPDAAAVSWVPGGRILLVEGGETMQPAHLREVDLADGTITELDARADAVTWVPRRGRGYAFIADGDGDRTSALTRINGDRGQFSTGGTMSEPTAHLAFFEGLDATPC